MGCAKAEELLCGLFEVGSGTKLRIYVTEDDESIPIANEINGLKTSSEGNLNDRLTNLTINMDLSTCPAFTSGTPTALFAPF